MCECCKSYRGNKVLLSVQSNVNATSIKGEAKICFGNRLCLDVYIDKYMFPHAPYSGGVTMANTIIRYCPKCGRELFEIEPSEPKEESDED